ncbi:MAG: hypothetical protein JW940_05570 [Polyangiaceae bacterium]|nr:hypothetical protein [Polyangiaceae bacterium]
MMACLTAYTQRASSKECDDGARSPCVDADALWLPAAPTRLISIPNARTLTARGVSSGLAFTYLSRPIVARASSPAPEGREVPVVRHASVATWMWAIGVGLGMELIAQLPLTLHQDGTGALALVSERARPLPSTALRDPKLGMGIDVFDLPSRSLGAGLGPLTGRFDLAMALPFGQKDRLAGSRSAVVAPEGTTTLRLGRTFMAASVGLRWRQPSRLSEARFGTAAQTSIGIGVDLLEHERLSTSIEAWALPELGSQTRTLPNGSTIEATLVPAEWLLSLRSAPMGEQGLSLQVGGGAALPLSSERRHDAAGTATEETFSGMTSCAVRLVFVARYQPP